MVQNYRTIVRRAVSMVAAVISILCAASLEAQIETTVPALKNVYAKDFYIGAILSYRHIGLPGDSAVSGQSTIADANGGLLMKFHMNSLSPGNNMKPQYTIDIAGSAAAYTAASAAAKDSVNTHPIVKFNGDMIAQLNWARKQGFTFRGHTLVWHSQTPTELFRTGYTSGGVRLTKDKMIERMDNYIGGIVRVLHQSWPGLLSAIDVVNEAINDGTGTFRTASNEWYTTFGDSSYVMKAFELTRKYTMLYGETQIKLYYNDYNTHDPLKANGIVQLLTPIFQAGLLDGIGMQEHDGISPTATPSAAGWVATYNKFSPICSEMAVTEIDVITGSGTPSVAVLATQANQYGMLFKCFVERSYRSGRGKIVNVTKDGLNDTYTFKTSQSSSLWDTLDHCKPAFFAAAGVGKNYNRLDSLAVYADSLKQSRYTTTSWSKLSAALTSGKAARSQNYSATLSADTLLGRAADTLKSAINGLVTVSVADGAMPDSPRYYVLSQNYPNPFNPTTRINYAVPREGYVTLRVYNVMGEEIKTLEAGNRQAGTHSITFDGSNLASGVYFYRLTAEGFVETKRFVLLK